MILETQIMANPFGQPENDDHDAGADRSPASSER